MERIKLTTRGLSPLEEKIAELALAIQAEGDKLPKNLAEKLIGDIYRATSKAAEYYASISGRKSYGVEDVRSVLKDIPENTFFHENEIALKLPHKSVTVMAALRKISNTDEEANIIPIVRSYGGTSYLKPAKLSKKRSFKRLYDERKYSATYAEAGFRSYRSMKDIPAEKHGELIELDVSELQELRRIVKYHEKWTKSKKFPSETIEEGMKRRSPAIARSILCRAAEKLHEKVKKVIGEKGYIVSDQWWSPQWEQIYLDNSFIFPHVVSLNGKRRDIREVEIYLPGNEEITGDKYRVKTFWNNFGKNCLEHMSLAKPFDLDGKVVENFWYDPVSLSLAKKRKLDQLAAPEMQTSYSK